MPRPAIKIAEFAVGNTNIGRIAIPVYNPSDLIVRNLFFSKTVAYVH
jgi:hypothetical protein